MTDSLVRAFADRSAIQSRFSMGEEKSACHGSTGGGHSLALAIIQAQPPTQSN